MSISLLQSKSLEAGTVSSTTLVFTSTVTAGSLKTCLLRIGSATVTATVSDDKDGAYTADLVTVNSSGATLTAYVFSRANATAGTTTITVTLSGAANLRMVIQEVAGIVTSSPLTGTPAGNTGSSTTPGSGSSTTTVANAFLCGFFTGSNAVAFGIVPDSPWVQDQQILSNADRLTSAYRIVSATGAYSATATIGASDGWTAQIAAYQGTGGGVQNQEVEAANRPRPGRGPFSKNQFRVSDTTAYTASTSNVTVGLTGQGASFAAGQLLGYAPQFYEAPNFPRPGRGPFSKGRFYVSDTTAFTSSSNSNVTAALTGQSAAFSAGSLTASASVTLAGQAGTLAPGTVAANLANALTGQADTFATGTVAPSAALALTGRSATFAAGTVSSGSDVTASLTGQAVTTSAGSIFAASQIAVAGQSATFAAGVLGANAAVALFGQSASASNGLFIPEIARSLTGVSGTGSGGTLSVSVTIQLAGQTLVSVTGLFNGGPVNTHQPYWAIGPSLARYT